MSCGGCCDPRLPRAAPVRLPGSSSSPGATIQNGRIIRRSRARAFFRYELYRISQVVQDPAQMTFREACVVVLGLYALYRGYFAGCGIWDLTVGTEVQGLCYGRSFAGCGRVLSWQVVCLLAVWLGQVIPWGLVCAVAVFFGEEMLQRKG